MSASPSPRPSHESVFTTESGQQFTIGERLGEKSGFARVYEAQPQPPLVESSMENIGAVALKVFNEFNPRTGKAEIDLIRNGQEVAPRLIHPRIVRAYMAGQGELRQDGVVSERTFLAMEQVPGGALSDALRSNTCLDLTQGIQIGEDLATALHYLHTEHNLVHRDVKPANVLCAAGHYKLADFDTVASPFDGRQVTRQREEVGSVFFAPREQWNRAATVSSDTFAVTALVINVLAGKSPVHKEGYKYLSIEQTCAQAGVPMQTYLDPFDPFMQKGLADNPDARYLTMEEWLEAFRDAYRAGLAKLGQQVSLPPPGPPPAANGHRPMPVVVDAGGKGHLRTRLYTHPGGLGASEEARVPESQTKIMVLQGELDQANAQLADAHSQLADVQSKLDEANTQLGAAQAANTNLAAQNSELQSQVGGLEREVRDLKRRLEFSSSQPPADVWIENLQTLLRDAREETAEQAARTAQAQQEAEQAAATTAAVLATKDRQIELIKERLRYTGSTEPLPENPHSRDILVGAAWALAESVFPPIHKIREAEMLAGLAAAIAPYSVEAAADMSDMLYRAGFYRQSVLAARDVARQDVRLATSMLAMRGLDVPHKLDPHKLDLLTMIGVGLAPYRPSLVANLRCTLPGPYQEIIDVALDIDNSSKVERALEGIVESGGNAYRKLDALSPVLAAHQPDLLIEATGPPKKYGHDPKVSPAVFKHVIRDLIPHRPSMALDLIQRTVRIDTADLAVRLVPYAPDEIIDVMSYGRYVNENDAFFLRLALRQTPDEAQPTIPLRLRDDYSALYSKIAQPYAGLQELLAQTTETSKLHGGNHTRTGYLTALALLGGLSRASNN